jgi:hypothetical protein
MQLCPLEGPSSRSVFTSPTEHCGLIGNTILPWNVLRDLLREGATVNEATNIQMTTVSRPLESRCSDTIVKIMLDGGLPRVPLPRDRGRSSARHAWCSNDLPVCLCRDGHGRKIRVLDQTLMVNWDMHPLTGRQTGMVL